MSAGGRNIGSRGTVMAVTCVGAVTVALGSMYFAGKDVKSKEGQGSIYKVSNDGGSDAAMNSSDVSAAVSLPKPGKERVGAPGSRTQS